MIGRNDPCWCGSGKKYKKCHWTSDRKKKNASTGRHNEKSMIKTPEEIAGMRKAGEFNGELMDYIRSYIKPGISTGELDNIAHDYIKRYGHIPACLGYHKFPKATCISLNNVVCHGIPSPDTFIRDGDIVNIDFTTIVNGFHGDSSETFIIGKVPDDARRIIEVSAQAMLIGIEATGPGKPLSCIGEAIEPFVKSNNCSVVRQYTGHGIGREFHEYFSVYHHIDKKSDKVTLRPGMTLTVEPMINLGGYEVITDKKDKWTVRTKDGSLSAQFEHTILVTGTGAEVLTRTPSQAKSGTLINIQG